MPSFILLFIYLFIDLFICLFVYLFIYLFIYLHPLSGLQRVKLKRNDAGQNQCFLVSYHFVLICL